MLCSCAFLTGSPWLPVVSASAHPDDMCVSASLGLFPTHTPRRGSSGKPLVSNLYFPPNPWQRGVFAPSCRWQQWIPCRPMSRGPGFQSQTELTCCEDSGTASPSWALGLPVCERAPGSHIGPCSLSVPVSKPGALIKHRQRCQCKAPPPLMSFENSTDDPSTYVQAS